MSGDNDDEMVTYSDFEHQHVEFRANLDNPDNSASYAVTQSVRPLEDRGALDNDEVAELVAIRVYPAIGIDDPGAVAGSDTAPGKLEFRGVLGANLDGADQLDAPTGTGDVEDIVTNEGNEGDLNAEVTNKTRSGVFYHWDTQLQTPFEDATSGAGGTGGVTGDTAAEFINLRELFGRGPILDQSDDMTARLRIIHDNVSFSTENALRVTMYWDVASVSSARREFGLPR